MGFDPFRLAQSNELSLRYCSKIAKVTRLRRFLRAENKKPAQRPGVVGISRCRSDVDIFDEAGIFLNINATNHQGKMIVGNISQCRDIIGLAPKSTVAT